MPLGIGKSSNISGGFFNPPDNLSKEKKI